MNCDDLARRPATKPIIGNEEDWAVWGVTDALAGEESYADHTLPAELSHNIYTQAYNTTKLKLLLLGDKYEQNESAGTIREALQSAGVPTGEERCNDLAVQTTEEWV